MPTNVPSPTFGPNGFIAPSEAAILAGEQADLQAAFGGDLNPALATPQGQLATSLTASIGNANDTFLFQSTQTDPAFAIGRWLDALARIYFTERNSSQPTTLQITCIGLTGVQILAGSLIVDQADNQYACISGGTIPSSGTINLAFACTTPGPVPVPTTVSIFQALSGWDTVTVISGVLGVNTETNSALRTRRAQSVAGNSVGMLGSVLGAVFAVSGVTDAYAIQNDTTGPQVITGVTLGPTSIYVAAAGGTDLAVATAIWSKKMPGCAYNGNTTIVVQDTNPLYSIPFPSYNVTFERPVGVQVLVAVVLLNSVLIPANAVSLIQQVLVEALAGAFIYPNGSSGPARATIGSEILATNYVGPVQSLGDWAQIVSLKVGSPNAPSASFTASVSSTTMSVSAVASGTLAVGQTVVDAMGELTAGTTITAFGTGVGGTGDYTLSNTFTVSSEAMVAVAADSDTVQVAINQVPDIVTNNLSVTLS